MRQILLVAAGLCAGILVLGDSANAITRTYLDPETHQMVEYEIFDNGQGYRLTGRTSAIQREVVDYDGPYGPKTIVISTSERRLYYVFEKGKAIKYGIGVGREGFQWSGTNSISRKAEWPDWTPPPEMLQRQPDLPRHMEGGIRNPLGARAMYIGATLYRIHGSNEPWTIGRAVSSGCIRMTNDDVVDLYDKVSIGTRVVVLR